ncbi:MAG: AhpC/TSA family protein [Mucilaginibacter sp.]|nr:AhpC/TSA family protein [Mucilaginibacter sp.]
MAELGRMAVGRPAPAFTLQSDQQQSWSLSDFKGKVVYLDLWASWCHPCRDETPYLKTLYQKYRNDDRVKFISIAISDVAKDWQKALKEDRPGWLQLTDHDGLVANAYGAHLIPKCVLIDKQGHIAMMDAPLPSSGQKLETLLLKEMEK